MESPLASSSKVQEAQEGSTSPPPKSDQPEKPPTLGGDVKSFYLVWKSGLIDALSVHRVARAVWKSSTVRSLLWHTSLLNGGLFLGSHMMYIYAIFPLLERIWGSGGSILLLFHIIYYVCWLGPLYIVTSILNAKWYDEIALKFMPKDTVISGSISEQLAERVYGLLLVQSLLLQVVLTSFVPYIGMPIAFFYSCWLYSFLATQYRWMEDTLLKRLGRIESNWIYFFGYGTPFTIVYFFFSFFVSVALCAILFPVFIILGMSCQPVRPKPHRTHLPSKVPIFKVAQRIGDYILYLVSFYLPWTALLRNKESSCTKTRDVHKSAQGNCTLDSLRPRGTPRSKDFIVEDTDSVCGNIRPSHLERQSNRSENVSKRTRSGGVSSR